MVLLSPSLQTSVCYYKSKLSSHNYTIYDKKSKEATCYDWNESEGDLLLNVENDWDGEVDCPEVMGLHCLISEEEVAAAIKGLKI